MKLKVEYLSYVTGEDGRTHPERYWGFLDTDEVAAIRMSSNKDVEGMVSHITLRHGSGRLIAIGSLVSRLSACLWTKRQDDWQSGCEKNTDLDPTQDGFKYCVFCGRELGVM